MADKYFKEDASGFYQLEDGSGSYLLETGVDEALRQNARGGMLRDASTRHPKRGNRIARNRRGRH